MIKQTVEIDGLNRAIALYRDLSGKTPEEVLLKQGGKLGFALSQHLHSLAPAKGEVRAERLDALKAGQGVHIRNRIKQRILTKFGARIDLKTRALIFGKKDKQSLVRKGGKRLNLQALMVEAELNIRESGRGFLSRSARYPKELTYEQFVQSRYGPLLSSAGLNQKRDTLTFEWDPSKSELAGSAVTGLNKEKAQAAIAAAVLDVKEDIQKYLSQKLAENSRKAGLS